MGIRYSEKELEILYYKAKHKNGIVKCPRCGKELIYKEAGNSYEVKCPTNECLKMTVRGL